MKLLTLCKDKFHLAAICSERDVCELVDYLSGTDSADKVSMVRLLEFTSEHGPPRNKEKSNYLEGKIFEFKHNQLRILYFFDERKLIVCTHHFVKKQQKAPKKEIKRAKELHKLYLQNKNNGNLQFVESI
jgi:phage-related protein